MNIEKAQQAHLLIVEVHWRAASLLHSVADGETPGSLYEGLKEISLAASKAVEAMYEASVGFPEDAGK